jgi:hypothetical protein
MADMAKAEMPKTRFMVVSAPKVGDVGEARGFGFADEVWRRVAVEFVFAERVSTIRVSWEGTVVT